MLSGALAPRSRRDSAKRTGDGRVPGKRPRRARGPGRAAREAVQAVGAPEAAAAPTRHVQRRAATAPVGFMEIVDQVLVVGE